MDLDKRIFSYGLKEKKVMLTLQNSVLPEYIKSGNYQVFYNILLRCFKKYREIPTLNVMEENAGKIWNDEFANIYKESFELETDSKELPMDIEKLKIRYNYQLLLKCGKNIYQENWDGSNFKDLEEANSILKKTSSGINDLYKENMFNEGSFAESARDDLRDYRETKENPEKVQGILLGLREFDRITNGLQESELMLIGGESSSGKSTLALNMAINAWLKGNVIPNTPAEVPDSFEVIGAHVLYFSIEMPFKPMKRRCNACMAGLPLYGIRDGSLSPQEETKFKAALKFQMKYPAQFHIIDVPRGCTMSMLESKYLEKKEEFNEDDKILIVIDYISLMTPDEERGSDWLNLGRLAEQMHEFCRHYQTSVISPVQLNRPQKSYGSSDNPPADQHRVGRSIMLSQNSNILLNIETRKEEETRQDMVVRIAKMRDGERGVFILQKRFDIMRLYDDAPGWEPHTYEENNESENNEIDESENSETNECQVQQ